MTENDELPEGITINKKDNYSFDLENQEEEINSSICKKCDIEFHAILYTSNKRHSGAIIAKPSGLVAWKNSLPKDRERSIEILNKNLYEKLDIHNERHNND